MSRINTGMWIKGHLMEVGEDYPHRMHRLLREAKRKRGIKSGSYQNFRNYVYWLRRLGLIEFVREEPSQKRAHMTPFNRRYYRLTAKGKKDVEAWRNPRAELYKESWEKSH